MKLIDILVRELPNLGGWPDGVIKMSQDYDGGVWCWRGHDYGKVNSFARIGEIAENHRKQGQDEELSCFVTREQYEAALAACKPEWDGEGFPPVGAEVECICNEFPNDGQEKLVGHILYSGEYTILKTYKTNNQHHAPVESVFKTKSWAIIPIRSEADKKKEEAIKAIDDAQYQVFGQDSTFSEYLYDAIAAGKIPHIRID